MQNKIDLDQQWNKFRNGDLLTDEELIAMWNQLEAALPYLDSRGAEFLFAARETRCSKILIESYLMARGRVRPKWKRFKPKNFCKGKAKPVLKKEKSYDTIQTRN
jgi:hypothetical protein